VRRSFNTLLKKMNGEIYKSGVRIVEGQIVYKESVIQAKPN
jgi:hypothetical protein